MQYKIQSIDYEEARRQHFKNLMQTVQRKIKYWNSRIDRTQPLNLMDEAHCKAEDAVWEYNFYKDALEALENNAFQYETGFVNGFKAGADSARPKWISTHERLPEYWMQVLAFRKHKHTPDDGYNEICVIRRSEEYGMANRNGYYDVTHWMPMPEPPEE